MSRLERIPRRLSLEQEADTCSAILGTSGPPDYSSLAMPYLPVTRLFPGRILNGEAQEGILSLVVGLPHLSIRLKKSTVQLRHIQKV